MGTRVGFVGVGTMGRPMALKLLKAGHEPTVYDVFPAAMEAVVAGGARAAGSSRETAAVGDVVIAMLPTSPHIAAAMCGLDGAIEGLRPGATLIDSRDRQFDETVMRGCRAAGGAVDCAGDEEPCGR